MTERLQHSPLEALRRRKDEWLKRALDSPIPSDVRAQFTGLSYYPENSALRFVTRLDEFHHKDQIRMSTSGDGAQEYLRWGRLHFLVEDQPAALTVYYASWGAYFVPFTDATSGVETYAGGRYLDLEPLEDGSFVVDFNLAYHPFCAYSEQYSCPIPPAENRVDPPIRAGEKLYRG